MQLSVLYKLSRRYRGPWAEAEEREDLALPAQPKVEGIVKSKGQELACQSWLSDDDSQRKMRMRTPYTYKYIPT